MMHFFYSKCLPAQLTRPMAALLLLAALALLRPLGASAQYIVSTLAGSTTGSTDGTGTAALFNSPQGVAVDGAGNVYVADRSNHKIRKITPAGAVTTLAGGGANGTTTGSTDGTGSAALFRFPTGVAVDGAGNVYVADQGNNKIRKVTPAGVVTTLAGGGANGTTSGSTDGTGTAALFAAPTGVAVDGAGNVYVTDQVNNKIRKLTPTGAVTTLAGGGVSGFANGNIDATGTAARFSTPIGVAVDAAGNVYVADQGNNTIRKVTPAGVVTTLAGGGSFGGSAFGSTDGTGTAALFNSPQGVAVDGAGNVYVGDTFNHKIRKITPAGVVTTLAGGGANGSTDGSTDGTGAAALFNRPIGVAVNGAGNVYVADNYNDKIRKITPVAVPTLTSLSPTSGPVGTSVTLTGTDLTGATGVSFNGTAATTYAVVNATTVTATVPTGASTGNVTVTTPGGTSNGVTFTVITDLMVSTGTQLAPTSIQAGAYNSITVSSNGNAVLAGNVSVAAFFTVQPGGGLSDGCSVISGAGTFMLGAGSILGICNAAGITSNGATGSVQVTGPRSFSTGASYGYNTAAAVTGSGLPATVASLAINTAGNVTLTNPVAVSAAVGVGGAGNLILNGNALTLLSSATGTALAVNTGTGVVSGNTAAVQRYITSMNTGRGYRHYSSPVSNSTVADLATAGFAPEVSQAATYNATARPDLVTPFPTVYAYDQSRVILSNFFAPFDRGFVVPASTASPLVVGQGYAVNIRGTERVDFVGTLNTGTVTRTLARNASGTANEAEAGWHLVGNPYPAPLDYALVAPATTGLDNSMYVYESASQYTGTYRSFVNGVPAANRYIASGQGFFVRVSSGQTSGTLTFSNNQRVTNPTTQVPFRRTAVDTRPLVQLELRGATGLTDAFYAYAEAGATPGTDPEFDAVKMTNPTGLNISSLAATGESLAIDGRPAFTAITVLPLVVGVPAAGTYTLTAAALANLPTGLDAYLTDAQTGQTVNLSTQASYFFTVTTAQASATVTGRFMLQFSASTALATASAITAAQVSVYPNPARTAVFVELPAALVQVGVMAALVDALGRVVLTQTLPAGPTTHTLPLANVAAGVYALRLQTDAGLVVKRLVVE